MSTNESPVPDDLLPLLDTAGYEVLRDDTDGSMGDFEGDWYIVKKGEPADNAYIVFYGSVSDRDGPSVTTFYGGGRRRVVNKPDKAHTYADLTRLAVMQLIMGDLG